VHGAIVEMILPASPAADSGLRRSDVVIEWKVS
jgi:S1-C subfamily serine protease